MQFPQLKKFGNWSWLWDLQIYKCINFMCPERSFSNRVFQWQIGHSWPFFKDLELVSKVTVVSVFKLLAAEIEFCPWPHESLLLSGFFTLKAKKKLIETLLTVIDPSGLKIRTPVLQKKLKSEPTIRSQFF